MTSVVFTFMVAPQFTTYMWINHDNIYLGHPGLVYNHLLFVLTTLNQLVTSDLKTLIRKTSSMGIQVEYESLANHRSIGID